MATITVQNVKAKKSDPVGWSLIATILVNTANLAEAAKLKLGSAITSQNVWDFCKACFEVREALDSGAWDVKDGNGNLIKVRSFQKFLQHHQNGSILQGASNTVRQYCDHGVALMRRVKGTLKGAKGVSLERFDMISRIAEGEISWAQSRELGATILQSDYEGILLGIQDGRKVSDAKKNYEATGDATVEPQKESKLTPSDRASQKLTELVKAVSNLKDEERIAFFDSMVRAHSDLTVGIVSANARYLRDRKVQTVPGFEAEVPTGTDG